jgi:ankyrin repeat protein
VKALVEGWMDVNQADIRGDSPLGLASEAGHEAVVRFLIGNGANNNRGMSTEWTALGRAVQNCHMAIARLLIDNGADLTSDWRVLSRVSETGDRTSVLIVISDF